MEKSANKDSKYKEFDENKLIESQYLEEDIEFKKIFFTNSGAASEKTDIAIGNSDDCAPDNCGRSDRNADRIINMRFNSEGQVADFGVRLGRACPPGTVIALVGDLGTGKTTLTKYIAQGLGVEESITSPTFTIVKSYYTGRIPLHHFDVYRLADEEEFYDIGGEEYFAGEGICIIEWADLISGAIPEDAIIIEITWGNGDERIYRCTF